MDKEIHESEISLQVPPDLILEDEYTKKVVENETLTGILPKNKENAPRTYKKGSVIIKIH